MTGHWFSDLVDAESIGEMVEGLTREYVLTRGSRIAINERHAEELNDSEKRPAQVCDR
jgi:hypothetical protein